jgi:hypothetical protein
MEVSVFFFFLKEWEVQISLYSKQKGMKLKQ